MNPFIDDKGKVWTKGAFKPVYAVRVGQKIFLLGSDIDEEPESRVDDNHLYVDWIVKGKSFRLGRRIPLSAPAKIPGTLFNGFENTKHADILAVDPCGEETVDRKFTGDSYIENNLESMSSNDFLQKFLDFQIKGQST